MLLTTSLKGKKLLLTILLRQTLPHSKPPSCPLMFLQVTLQAGRIYKWCSCGASKSQPFCDGSHHSVMTGPNFEFPTKPKFRPVKFRVPEDGEYWLCQCKQTNDRPFCDGTHRTMEEITKLERPMPTDGKRVTVKIKG